MWFLVGSVPRFSGSSCRLTRTVHDGKSMHLLSEQFILLRNNTSCCGIHHSFCIPPRGFAVFPPPRTSPRVGLLTSLTSSFTQKRWYREGFVSQGRKRRRRGGGDRSGELGGGREGGREGRRKGRGRREETLERERERLYLISAVSQPVAGGYTSHQPLQDPK